MKKKELIKKISVLLSKAENKMEEGIWCSALQIAEHLQEFRNGEVNTSEASALNNAGTWLHYSTGCGDGAEPGEWAIAARYFTEAEMQKMERPEAEGFLQIPRGSKSWEDWQAKQLRRAWKRIRVLQQYNDIKKI